MDALEVIILSLTMCLTSKQRTLPPAGCGGFDELKPFSAIKKDFDEKGNQKLDSDNYIEVCAYFCAARINMLAPLLINFIALQSQYDEMALSALLSMCSPCVFVNNGSRENQGRLAKDASSYERYGVYVGQVGARFEQKRLMEARHMVVTPTQNTIANGYGPPSTASVPTTTDVSPSTSASSDASIEDRDSPSSTAAAPSDANAATMPAQTVSSMEAEPASQSTSESATPSTSASATATATATTATKTKAQSRHAYDRAHELLRLWSRFYGLSDSGFPLYKDVHESMQQASDTDQIRDRYAPIAENPEQFGYLDLLVYRRRIAVVAETFLCAANTWGAHMTAAARYPVFAYAHVVGLGLGVWRVSKQQGVCMLEVYRDLLCGFGTDEWFGSGDWPHIRELDFSYFNVSARTFWDVWKSVAVVKSPTSKTVGGGSSEGTSATANRKQSGGADPVFEFLRAAAKADRKQKETGCQISIVVKSRKGYRFRVMLSRRNPAQRLHDDYLESFFPPGMLFCDMDKCIEHCHSGCA